MTIRTVLVTGAAKGLGEAIARRVGGTGTGWWCIITVRHGTRRRWRRS